MSANLPSGPLTLWATHVGALPPYGSMQMCVDYQFQVGTAPSALVLWVANDLNLRYSRLGWSFVPMPPGAGPPTHDENGAAFPTERCAPGSVEGGATCATRRYR
jgi:hypothetical protein